MNFIQFLSPAGALFSLLCFILPWFTITVLGSWKYLFGIQSGLLAWQVALLAIATAAAFFLKYIPQNILPPALLAKIAVIGLSLLALLIMIIIAFSNTTSNMFAGISLTFGWFGSFFGFLVAIAGAFFINDEKKLPFQT